MRALRLRSIANAVSRGRGSTALRAGLLAIGCVAAGWTPIADGDVFWHLAAGREMVRTRALLWTDPFSTGAAGRPWVDVHWLFQLAAYAVHALGGLAGLVIAKCCLLTLGAWLLFAALGRPARALFVPLLVGALFCARHLLLVRPVIVSLLLIALFFLQLERFRKHGRVAVLVALPFTQVVWANCQGLSPLGPALVLAYALGAAISARYAGRSGFPFVDEAAAAIGTRRARALFAIFGLCLAASLVTPYGTRALALSASLLARLLPHSGQPYAQVAENVPPFMLERVAPGQLWHLPWFLGLLAIGGAVSIRRIVLSHLLVVVGFVGLALIANRNVLLMYWIATPILAQQLAPALRRVVFAWRRWHAASVARRIGVALSVGLISIAGAAAAREPRISEPTPFHMPVESTDQLQKAFPPGSVFCADHYGGYLIWRLYPNFKPFIDTRLVLRTPDEYSEYLRLADEPERFDAFQQRHVFSYVVLPVAYPDRYLDLIGHLYASEAWKLELTDGATVLFARSDRVRGPGWDLADPALTTRVMAELALRYHDAPALLSAALLQLATLDIAVQAIEQADRVLSGMSSPAALALRARARLAAGDLDAAERLARQLATIRDEEAGTHDLLAMVHMRRGHMNEALAQLRRALAIDPFDVEATRLLAAVEEHDEAH